jgi:hypothetical protein
MGPEQWQRVKETFARIVEQPEAQREQLLRELCGDDLELQHEVTSMLEADADPKNESRRTRSGSPQG